MIFTRFIWYTESFSYLRNLYSIPAYAAPSRLAQTAVSDSPRRRLCNCPAMPSVRFLAIFHACNEVNDGRVLNASRTPQGFLGR